MPAGAAGAATATGPTAMFAVVDLPAAADSVADGRGSVVSDVLAIREAEPASAVSARWRLRCLC